MTQTLSILSPIFILLILGYALRSQKVLQEGFWDGLNRAIYFVFFPSLIVYKLSTTKLDYESGLDILLVGLIGLAIMTAVAVISSKAFDLRKTDLPVMVQAFIRFNAFLFLAFVDVLLEEEFFVFAILISVMSIIFVNTLSVYFLSAQDDAKSWEALVNTGGQLAKNPLVIASIVGLFINGFALTLPPVAENSLRLLSEPTLVLGVLSVGAGLHWRNLWERKYLVLYICATRLILHPLIVFVIGRWFGLEEPLLFMLCLFAGNSTAISSYILTKEMKGDHQLMSSVITALVLFSLPTLMGIIYLFTA